MPPAIYVHGDLDAALRRQHHKEGVNCKSSRKWRQEQVA